MRCTYVPVVNQSINQSSALLIHTPVSLCQTEIPTTPHLGASGPSPTLPHRYIPAACTVCGPGAGTTLPVPASARPALSSGGGHAPATNNHTTTAQSNNSRKHVERQWPNCARLPHPHPRQVRREVVPPPRTGNTNPNPTIARVLHHHASPRVPLPPPPLSRRV